MKVAKRTWQLSTYINDQDMLNKLSPLFQSDIGLLNQIASDIDVLKLMFARLDQSQLPLDEMIEEVDQFKARLSTFQEVKLDEEMIVEHHRKYGKKSDIEMIVDNLTHLEKDLIAHINIFKRNWH